MINSVKNWIKFLQTSTYGQQLICTSSHHYRSNSTIDTTTAEKLEGPHGGGVNFDPISFTPPFPSCCHHYLPHCHCTDWFLSLSASIQPSVNPEASPQINKKFKCLWCYASSPKEKRQSQKLEGTKYTWSPGSLKLKGRIRRVPKGGCA